jgi:hypothetical protein
MWDTAPTHHESEGWAWYCDTGTVSSAPHGVYKYQGSAGKVDYETTIKRTSDAANDGTRDYSWKLTPVATYTRRDSPLYTPWMCVWHDGTSEGNKDLTVYLASNSTLNSEDVFLEVGHQNEGSTAADGVWNNNDPGYNKGQTNLTDLNTGWSGSPTYEYELKVTGVSPYYAGVVACRLGYVKSGTQVIYVDPTPRLATP